MKKNLLFILASVMVVGVNGQQKSMLPQSKTPFPRANQSNLVSLPANYSYGDPYYLPLNVNPSLHFVTANKMSSLSEAIIGNTQYDLQTNSGIMNRLLYHDDGTFSATWTFIPIGGVSNDRGTGYNYYDGTNWGSFPSARVEPTNRTGFTNVVVTNSGKELVFAHSSTLPGMLMTARPAKGTGSWTEYGSALGMGANDTWSKAIKGGSNGETIHCIWQGSGVSGVPLLGQDGPLFYSRSDDGGNTWPVLKTVIPALDSSHFFGFGADCYAMDTKGDTVVIVAGDWTTDLILLKSVDNGNTWTTTYIEQFPIALYNDATMMLPDTDGDGLGDRIENNAGDAHPLIDNNGLVHVWFTKVLINDPDSAATLTYYPNSTDGLYYWNENFGANPPALIAAMEDFNGDGVINVPSGGANNANGMGGYRGGGTQMPTAGVDASNNLYVSYQNFDERCDTTIYPGVGHKHVYVITSSDGGATWSTPYDVVPGPPADGLLQEGVFACMARRVDNAVHLIYQRDYAPGHSISSNTTEAGWNADPSDIVFVNIPVTDLVGINENQAVNDFSVSQNVPNPASQGTSINVTLNKPAQVEFKVNDLLGKVIYSEKRGTQQSGTFTIHLNTSNLQSGVYCYTVSVDGKSVTKKLIVE